MPILLRSFAAYLMGDAQMRDGDHEAQKLVKLIKDEPIKRVAVVPAGGSTWRIPNGDRKLACGVFGLWAADQLYNMGVKACTLFPVPAREALVGTTDDFHSWEMARLVAAQAKMPCQVAPIFRWKTPRESTRNKGTRDPRVLFEDLATTGDLDDVTGVAILIDDVCTSGGHLQACAAALREIAIPCDIALVAGRTVYSQLADPFAVPDEMLPDFDPENPFPEFT